MSATNRCQGKRPGESKDECDHLSPVELHVLRLCGQEVRLDIQQKMLGILGISCILTKGFHWGNTLILTCKSRRMKLVIAYRHERT